MSVRVKVRFKVWGPSYRVRPPRSLCKQHNSVSSAVVPAKFKPVFHSLEMGTCFFCIRGVFGIRDLELGGDEDTGSVGG